MRKPLFNTLARVFGARKAKRLIAGLSFSAPEYSDVNENCVMPNGAFNAHEEVNGFWYWVDVERKFYRRIEKPCKECGRLRFNLLRDPDDFCSICCLPF